MSIGLYPNAHPDGMLILNFFQNLIQWGLKGLIGNIPVVILQILFAYLPSTADSSPEALSEWSKRYRRFEVPRKLHHLILGSATVIIFEIYPPDYAWRSLELLLVVFCFITLLKYLSNRFNNFYTAAGGSVLRDYEKGRFNIPHVMGFYGSTYLIGFVAPYHAAPFSMLMMVIVDPACAIGSKFNRPFAVRRENGFDLKAFSFGAVPGTLAVLIWYKLVLDRIAPIEDSSLVSPFIFGFGTFVSALFLGCMTAWCENWWLGPLDDNFTIPLIVCAVAALASCLPFSLTDLGSGSVLEGHSLTSMSGVAAVAVERFRQIFTS